MGYFDEIGRDFVDFCAAADSFIEREKATQQRLAELEENYFFEKDEDDDE